MIKKTQLFLFVCIFLNFSVLNFVYAENYFDQILAGVSKIGIIQRNINFWNFGKLSEPGLQRLNDSTDLQPRAEIESSEKSSDENKNVFMSEEKDYFSDSGNEEGELVLSKAEQKKIEEAKKNEEAKKKQENILGNILSKLGLTTTPASSQVSAPIISSQPISSLQPQSLQQPQFQQPINPNQFLQNGGLSPYSGNAVQQYLPNSVPNTQAKMLATPYNGPGGSLPGECGIPKGPWAYNIGGDSVSCNAEVTVSGFKSQLRGKFGAGYINPLTEKGQSRPGSGAGNCADSSTAKQYGEGCFSSYAGGSGQAYIQEQLLYWQAEGTAKGQKCVPVDIDNCDSIGSANYKNILDQVESFNNQASVKIKVLTKNPHLGSCNFFSHPAVVGAFIEEISPSDAQKVSQMRNKPEQILLFARGGSGTNQKLKQIESLKIPNSSYSYDEGSEYQNVTDCTYNP
jgi:hypothetical protein